MRILALVHFLPYPPHGGLAQRTFNLLKQLSAHNEVHVVCFAQKAHHSSPSAVEEAVTALSQTVANVTCIPLDSNQGFRARLMTYGAIASARPLVVQRFRSAAFEAAVRAKLAETTFDVAHFDTLALAQYAPLVSGIPSVLVHHNIESTLLLRRAVSEKNFAKRGVFGWEGRKLFRYETRVMPEFQQHLMCSEQEKDELRGRGVSSVAVIPNGVDTDYFTPLGIGTEPLLLYSGLMNYAPNEDAVSFFCEHIYPTIRASRPDTAFEIVGRHPSEKVLRLQSDPVRIRVVGAVEDMRPFLERASVVVVPIRVGAGTRLKILDAMSAGKAIVSTSIGAEGLDVTHGRDIIIADDPTEFAAATLRLLENGDERRGLGEAARKTVLERYSWTLIGRRQEEVYRSLARAR